MQVYECNHCSTTVVVVWGFGLRKVESSEEGTILTSGFGTRGRALYEGSSHRKLEEMLKQGREGVRYVLYCLGGKFSPSAPHLWGHRKWTSSPSPQSYVNFYHPSHLVPAAGPYAPPSFP